MTTTHSAKPVTDGGGNPPSAAAGQPPITPGAGLISTDWLPGPSDATRSPVVVSFTDFHAESEADWLRIAELGVKLAESWPIMHGAVGLWLWGRPAEWRGGSLSVWDGGADLRRFIRWPVHAEIMKSWRGRVRVESASWSDERFDPTHAWRRAEEHMRVARLTT
ncbi:hypothetical protein [Mycobacterium sp. Marseille-P9652]|uniref:hypothetical protein n=1 Tax=Mycobacterium sp. Marseille-P9652 TaxID=2654950 RepID=UPI0012E758FA|nr:hypothetical protein [Mycobacterium sp. Marseille-P9652]